MCSCFFWFSLSCTWAVCDVPSKDCKEQSVQSSFFFFFLFLSARCFSESRKGGLCWSTGISKGRDRRKHSEMSRRFSDDSSKKAEVALEMWALRLVLWCRCIKSSGRCLEGVLFFFLGFYPHVEVKPACCSTRATSQTSCSSFLPLSCVQFQNKAAT